MAGNGTPLDEAGMAEALETLQVIAADLPSGRYLEFLSDLQTNPANRIMDEVPLLDGPRPPSASNYIPPARTAAWHKPSTWTTRYGVSRTSPHVGHGRSWIDPEFPRLDPNTLEPVNPPRLGESIPEPHPEDLDRLFHTEELQRIALGGMRTWEAILIAQQEENIPKDMQPLAWNTTLAESKLIDESKWLNVLKKDRWVCDFAETFNGRTKTWTVDEPRFWGEFRQVLDISDRILKEAANTTW
ncbi:hypothetical protein ACHAQH_006706 [Verticillium albo-atrum]